MKEEHVEELNRWIEYQLDQHFDSSEVDFFVKKLRYKLETMKEEDASNETGRV